MTYHDALMTQLQKLVEIVRVLRSKLKSVDQDSLKVSESLYDITGRTNHLCDLSLFAAVPKTLPTQAKT